MSRALIIRVGLGVVFCVWRATAQIPVGLPLSTTFSCPVLPQSQLSGSTVTLALPISPNTPDEPIRSLAVRVVTSNDLLSGTNDDVWLDIGPKAWKIGDDFDRGSTKTVMVNLSSRDPNIDIPDLVPLYVRDISKLRLEKKGLCGLTDAPDSIASAGFPSIPTPEAMIAALKQQVAYAQYALAQQQTLVDVQQKLLDQQVQFIAAAQQTIAAASNEIATIPGQIANLQNQIVNIQKQIVQTPGQIAQRTCHNESVGARVVLGILTGGTSEAVCATANVANPVFQSLTNTAASLAQSKNNLVAELQAATIRKTTAAQTLATATVTKTTVEAAKKKDELQYAVAHATLDGAQNALADAEALAKKIPLPNLALPTPGQWKIDKVTLIVNGHDFATFNVGETLKQGHAEWSQSIPQMSGEEQFAKGLRINVNKPSTVADEMLARVTTIFKLSDISGWKPGPVAVARAVGVLINAPSPGDDGFVSLDLGLEEMEVNNRAFVLDDQHGIGHKRYIRIEYKNRDASGKVDNRYTSWGGGTKLVVQGPVMWDTDRNGFYELHPDRPEQISTLQPGQSGATSDIVLWWRRLT